MGVWWVVIRIADEVQKITMAGGIQVPCGISKQAKYSEQSHALKCFPLPKSERKA
jgi:hypothetical protein